MSNTTVNLNNEGRKLANIILKFFDQQRKDIEVSKKKEIIQININPDSYIGKEILYQTVLLKSIKEDISEIRMMIKEK